MKSNNKFEVGENGETKVQRRTKQRYSVGVTIGDRRWAEHCILFLIYNVSKSSKQCFMNVKNWVKFEIILMEQ